MSETQWKQFVQLFAQKNQHLTKQQVLQQAKKPFRQLEKYFSQRGGAGNSMQQMMRERASRLQARNTATTEAAAAEAKAAAAAAAAARQEMINLSPITSFISDLNSINAKIKKWLETVAESLARKKFPEDKLRDEISSDAYRTIRYLHRNINIINSPYITENHLDEIRAKFAELVSLLPNLRFMGDLEFKLDEIGTWMLEIGSYTCRA